MIGYSLKLSTYHNENISILYVTRVHDKMKETKKLIPFATCEVPIKSFRLSVRLKQIKNRWTDFNETLYSKFY
jgi:hypothetical protein